MKNLKLLIVLLCLFSVNELIEAQTTYTSVNSGDWGSTDTWSPAGIPGPGDIAVITGYYVQTDGSRQVAELHIIQGNLQFTGTPNAVVTITDSAYWSDGVIQGGPPNYFGGEIVIPEGAVLNLDGPSTSISDSTLITNMGTIRQVGDNGIIISGFSVIDNQAMFEIAGNAGFTGGAFSGGKLINTGTLMKTSGNGVARFDNWWSIDNENGDIDVRNGTLQFYCDGTYNGGTYNADAGATLSFESQTHTFMGTLSGSPAGIVKLGTSGSNLNTNGGEVTLDFQGSGFQLSGGNLIGKGQITIPEDATLVLSGENNASLTDSVTLLNMGTIVQEGSLGMSIKGNSIVDNQALFDITSDAQFIGGANIGGTFMNAGILRKSAGSGEANFNMWWDMQNQNGTIDVQSGTLSFDCNGTYNGGTYTTSVGTTLDFRSGTHTVEGTLKGDQEGTLMVSGNNLKIVPADVMIDFTGKGFHWTGGNIAGGGTLTLSENTMLTVDGTGVTLLKEATHLVNEGTIRQEGSMGISIQGLSQLENKSLFDIVSDATYTGGPFTGGTLINTGTLQKSDGDAVASFDAWWDIQNYTDGIINASSGTLKFDKMSDDEGSMIEGTAAIDVPAGFNSKGITSPGNSPGKLSYLGDFRPTSTAHLMLELAGYEAGVTYDQLTVDGNAVLNGMIEINTANGFKPEKGDSFTVLETTGSVSGNFASIVVQPELFVSVKRNAKNVVIVVDSVGALGIEEINDAADQFSLHQNYPNPFSGNTTIGFELPETSEVNLEIYNSKGKLVTTLVSEKLSAGEYEYKWNAVGLPKGYYFCRFQTGQVIKTKKMLLIN